LLFDNLKDYDKNGELHMRRGNGLALTFSS